MAEQYTQKQVSAYVVAWCAAASKGEARRAMNDLADRFGHPMAAGTATPIGERKVWGLAIGAQRHTHPPPGMPDAGTDKPTWGERQILEWAFPKKGIVPGVQPKESTYRPTAADIAALIGRPVDWVRQQRRAVRGQVGDGLGVVEED